MKHIEYLPNKKVLINLTSEITLHLTEKENLLLNYLYNNRHLKLTKNNLLNDTCTKGTAGDVRNSYPREPPMPLVWEK